MIVSWNVVRFALRCNNVRYYYKTGTIVPPFKDPDIPRKRHGLTRSSMEPDPVVEAPDWSFADGRPAPLWNKQKRRVVLQMHYAKVIEDLLKEVDYAEKRHAKIKNEEHTRDQTIIETKLREKGRSRYTNQESSNTRKKYKM